MRKEERGTGSDIISQRLCIVAKGTCTLPPWVLFNAFRIRQWAGSVCRGRGCSRHQVHTATLNSQRSPAAWTLRTSLEYCSSGAAPPPLWIRHSVGTTCTTVSPGGRDARGDLKCTPQRAMLARTSNRPAYMVCDPSTVIVHHGVSEQEAIKRRPDTTAQIGSKFGRHTREMSNKVRPHLSVGKLIEISSKDNTRVGNMGEVRD